MKRGEVRRWLFVLLLLPFAGTLSVPLYNRAGPSLWGIPFFYWYQLAWIVLTASLLGVFVASTRDRDV